MLVGRKKEIGILNDMLQSNSSELMAVYGRRRVGKTFLIRETYKSNIVFEIKGYYKGSMRDQLRNFQAQLKAASGRFRNVQAPVDWFAAFRMLAAYLDGLKSDKKKVIFIDEFPWIAAARSYFLTAFEHFWNTYCTKRNDLVVVVCGSAASFMLNKIVKNKGGLHNRLSCKIRLMPFDLHETKEFLMSKNIKLSNFDIVQLYIQAFSYLFRGPDQNTYLINDTEIRRYSHLLPELNESSTIISQNKINNEIYPLHSGSELSHDENDLEIVLSVLSYRNPELNRYAAFLEGKDTAWQVSISPVFSYQNLKPGNYILYYRGANFTGQWGPEKEILFTILPAPWFTKWAIAGYGLVLILIAVIFITLRRRNVTLTRGLQEKTVELGQLKKQFQGELLNNLTTNKREGRYRRKSRFRGMGG